MRNHTKASVLNSNSRSIDLYDSSFEKDSCGIAFSARIDAEPDRKIVEMSLQALINLEHRGALGGDKSTGDGAGIMIEIPDKFFRKKLALPAKDNYAAGVFFLPKNENKKLRIKKIIEVALELEGFKSICWREVPVDSSKIGEIARLSEPAIEQLFIAANGLDKDIIERKLYIARKAIEKRAKELIEDPSEFYVCSLSYYKIIYKGMLTASQLSEYYLDLKDEDIISKFCIAHQRFSTNTFPAWRLAQPFRFIAHNGEINTLSGNILRMKIRESKLKSDLFGEDIEKIKPIIDESGSDSAIFDNALELLVMGGRSLPHAIMMMIPEAYGGKIQMSEDKKAFYEFHSAIMEPWDGPAAMIFCDRKYIGATLDRNGLRPARYSITKDGYLFLASEAGAFKLDDENICENGKLSPGKMLLLDFEEKRIISDKEIKSKISRQQPYRRWIKENLISLRGLFSPPIPPKVESKQELFQKLQVFGYTQEELTKIINPMASFGQEAVGSMGNDTPLAALSDRPNLLFYYFKQRFAQVTNPPIDPLREELVMSLETFVGGEGNLLVECPENYKGFKLSQPVLTEEDLLKIKQALANGINVVEIDALFDKKEGASALENAINKILEKIKNLVKGNTIIILSDRNFNERLVPIPSLLAVSAVYHFLIDNGLRADASIVVDTGEAREVMNFAMLISYGADAVCPYVALQTVKYLADNNLLERKISAEDAIDFYILAVNKGLLKTMSRLGISTLHSYFGSQIFEAIGIKKDVIDKYFKGTICRLEGIDLSDIQEDAIRRHNQEFDNVSNDNSFLDPGGEYSVRIGGEVHFWNAETIAKFQYAVRNEDYAAFKEFTNLINNSDKVPLTIRRLFKFKKTNPIPIEEVEPVESIVKRFVVSAMSFGSLSKEAHETIAIAANRIGARSNSGEGGEDPLRNVVLKNGDCSNSKVKQVASGRFGVTLEYLTSAEELQIKIAQGAKPGEGGQLPGHKVTQDIARVRNTTPGVTLISPPPHHDIYSIEDIAQLIYDLKSVNPKAKVSVKLVSETGVGTIAAGVAKANADIILISGYEGGTGASPLTSIKHTGIPWEIGLAETHQTLILNKLREKVKLQVDGQLKTGRDLAIAAILGAEEFGFATSVLIAIGCSMLRKCHLNACSFGVATQDERLRKRFDGKPEYVVNFFKFLAMELREIMSELGVRKVDELVGRTDLIEYDPPKNFKRAQKFDPTPILGGSFASKNFICSSSSISIVESLDEKILIEVEKFLSHRKENETLQLFYEISNVNRSIGARLSGELFLKKKKINLSKESIIIKFRGCAGQSFGAFLDESLVFELEGEANDYLGKGLCGGKIIVMKPSNATFSAEQNVICGNVALYGATKGFAYINGIAGERFCVRNSGAIAVVEGVGDHACEYMTGGVVVCLGKTGHNFAAGMSGGIAFVFDENQMFDRYANLDMVDLEAIKNEEDEKLLKTLISNHYYYTKSRKAKEILDKWISALPLFVKVVPLDYRKIIEKIKLPVDLISETVSSTEEVFHV